MAFGSESDESVDSIIFSKLSANDSPESQKTLSKSSAYWKTQTEQNSNNKEKKYCCMIKDCIAKFSRPWRLKAHLSVHYGKKPFPCTEEGCNKAYTSIYHLRRHKANVHSRVSSTKPLYKCEFPNCKAEFKTSQNAKKHYKRTHEGRTCKECGKIFAKRSQLVAHQFEHTGIAPFKCLTCNIGYIKKTELTKHQSRHREHICPEKGCFLAFKTWSEVKEHLIIHPKNYVCILCRKSYVCRKDLKEHILKHSDPQFKKPKKTILKTFQCDQCPSKLIGKASLKRHISVIHEGKHGQGKLPTDPPKPRAPRKDKGSVKKAIAPKLADIEIPLDIEKKLLKRDDNILVNDEELEQTVIQHLMDLEKSVEESDGLEESSNS